MALEDMWTLGKGSITMHMVGRGGTSQQWRMDCRAKTRKLGWGYVIGALNAKLRSKQMSKEMIL